MPGSPGRNPGLPASVISVINGLIQDNAGESDWLSLQFGISNTVVGMLSDFGVQQPGSHRGDVFAAVRFGIDAYLAAQSAQNALENNTTSTYEPPFDPGQQAAYEYTISFTLPGAPDELDRPIYLNLPTDGPLSDSDIQEAIANLMDELAHFYEMDGVGSPEDYDILFMSRGTR
jgi:hypothetical protein